MTGDEIKNLGDQISEAYATDLLFKHINDYYYKEVLRIVVKRGVRNPLQREIDAFTSFAYNEGVGSFSTSTLLKKYVAGERGESIHEEFKKWTLAGGVHLAGLARRREEEWRIFSGSSQQILGYNCPPKIDIIGRNGLPTGRYVTDNNGYGHKPA